MSAITSTKRCLTVFAVASLFMGVAHAAGADRAARADAKTCDKPEFPVRWQDDGDGGTVTVAYLVDTDGKVMDSRIVESSGYGRVDRASIRAGARCKFQPGARDGQVAPTWAKVQYSWVVE